MKPGHERVIEAMARAIDSQAFEASSWKDVATGALHAAAKEGFVLAKLPEEKEEPDLPPIDRHGYWEMGEIEGWNWCLESIETITFDKE